jgi:hypothetical protein
MHGGPRKPAVPVILFQGRLPVEVDKLRRKLQQNSTSVRRNCLRELSRRLIAK